MATEEELDIVALINAAKKGRYGSWISPSQSKSLVAKVRADYDLTPQESRAVHSFLIKSPFVKDIIAKYADLETLIDENDSKEVLKTFGRQILQNLYETIKLAKTNPEKFREIYGEEALRDFRKIENSLYEKANVTHLVMTVQNLGVIEMHRPQKSRNDAGDTIIYRVLPYSPKLGEKLLYRYYANKMQTMTIEEAEKCVKELRKKVGQ
ncbi:MAG: hypothetical protein QXM31_03100 [Candidatus Woesearchaeota archaeon]